MFCYGATGAGKTHTYPIFGLKSCDRMLGTREQPGIMFRAIRDLVAGVSQPTNYEYRMRMWYVEVYNETLNDLLLPAGKGARLDLREDPVKGVSVAGAKEVMVASIDDVMEMLSVGNKNRTKESTWANATSSRSHAVLQVVVERRDKVESVSGELAIAKLTLIDLAGSERAAVTRNKGVRLLEGANINRSLLALANCINALATQQLRPGKGLHVPYRDSKLTRLLKETLGGKCRTVMIANISPSEECYEDTLNTLKYANRAKHIKTVVARNVLNVQTHINNYQRVITQLKEQVTELRGQLEEARHEHTREDTQPSSTQQREHDQDANSEQKLPYYPSEKIKRLDCMLQVQFEREVKIKKKVLETEQESQNLGFKLFAAQVKLGKGSSASGAAAKEAQELKRLIESNNRKIKAYFQALQEAEEERETMLTNMKQNMLRSSIDHEAFRFLLRNQEYSSQQVDYDRNSAYAMYQLKQRENYIEYLRNVLQSKYCFSCMIRASGKGTVTQEDLEENEKMVSMLRMESMLLTPTLPPIRKGACLDEARPSMLFLTRDRAKPAFKTPVGIEKMTSLQPNTRLALNSKKPEGLHR